MLCRHGNFRIAMMGQGCEFVERRSHVQWNAGGVKQGQIYRHSARMRRPPTGIGKEVGVRRVVPQCPLRFRRSEGIEYTNPATERLSGGAGVLQRRCGRAMQITHGVSINRRVREIVCGRIGKRNVDVEFLRRDFNEFHDPRLPNRVDDSRVLYHIVRSV